MAQAVLPHLKKGSAIVNTGSIVGIVGNKILIDYTATKERSMRLPSHSRYRWASAVYVSMLSLPGPVWDAQHSRHDAGRRGGALRP